MWNKITKSWIQVKTKEKAKNNKKKTLEYIHFRTRKSDHLCVILGYLLGTWGALESEYHLMHYINFTTLMDYINFTSARVAHFCVLVITCHPSSLISTCTHTSSIRRVPEHGTDLQVKSPSGMLIFILHGIFRDFKINVTAALLWNQMRHPDSLGQSTAKW